MSDFITAKSSGDAKRDPVRIVVVQGEARPAVDVDDEELVMTFPHLLVRESLAFIGLSLGLVLLSIFVDAPLGDLADPTRTPNPAKAPWYFVGLQELLHYYPPVVAGVVLPSLLLFALAIVPYARINLVRAPLERKHLPAVAIAVAAISLVLAFGAHHVVWPLLVPLWLVGGVMLLGAASHSSRKFFVWLRSRSLPFWIFLWFLVAATTLTLIGMLFRGPGWSVTLPWRDGIFG